MKPHQHAEVLRAIADGVPPSEFEVQSPSWNKGEWDEASPLAYWIIGADPENWKVRRKPQYITVNGFKVPKPLDAVPKEVIFTPYLMGFDTKLWMDGYQVWGTETAKSHAVSTGIAHATKKAAIAHTKAMLGIDPEAA